jgi:hypothetical protein
MRFEKLEKLGLDIEREFDLEILKETLLDMTYDLFGVDLSSGWSFFIIQVSTVVEDVPQVDPMKVEMFFSSLRNAYCYSDSVYQFFGNLDLAFDIIGDDDLRMLKMKVK